LKGVHVDTTDSNAPAHPSIEEEKLAQLEERYRHELMDDEERQEVYAQLVAMRRRLRHSREGC
jgi:hypothetical protein